MAREYRYRAHIRWAQYAAPILSSICLLVVWSLAARLYFEAVRAGQSLFAEPGVFVLAAIAGLSVVLLLEALLLWYLFYRMAGVRVFIEKDWVVYRSHTSEKHISFHDIIELKFPSVRYVGGWVKIVSHSDAIRLTVVLEDIGDFLQELKTALDNRNLSHRYDRAKFFRFLKTAIYADHSWARLYSIFWKLILITVLSVAVGLFFAMVAGTGILGLILWLSASFYWPLAVWIGAEIVLMRTVGAESVEETFTFPIRDTAYEKAVYRKAAL
ncbi:MAG TPA: hypothetical protein HPP77_11185 [Candidatus Hydrogenedentes bacterium]|nr:hypothetical protein [Candidatus Hydrogenedentota bacterium]HIJ74501.1 hypothetical protein [Candidatus Hydrogenedentota bacterium]